MELYVRIRRDLELDSEFDLICVLFYCILFDILLSDIDKIEFIGVIVIDKDKIVFS